MTRSSHPSASHFALCLLLYMLAQSRHDYLYLLCLEHISCSTYFLLYNIILKKLFTLNARLTTSKSHKGDLQ